MLPLSPNITTRKVDIETLLHMAQGLKSEDGENPEYDRALCELICEAALLPMDCMPIIAQEIGLGTEEEAV